MPVNHIVSYVALASKARLDSVKGQVNVTNNREIFSDILQEALKEPNSLAATTEAVPLDKNQIEFMIKNLQIQMNRQLFNIVFNSPEEGTNFLPSKIMSDYGALKNIAILDASINRQISPKNNVQKQDINLESIIEKAARKYDLDADLIRAVIKAESNFDPQATSSKGAMGLMQLMPETAKDLGVKNAYDVKQNVLAGTSYLKSLLDRYDGKINLALAAYNWGMGNLERSPDNLPDETINYIARVNNYLKNIKE
ncbi:MAG: lytic transglycosylase domain-containing protein [Deltaproteobacteria bacterium]